MANMFCFICVLVAGLSGVLAAPPTPPPPGEHDSCKAWDKIASELTQNTGTQQECWSNSTQPCTRIDCKGAYEYNAETSLIPLGSRSIEVDYCFGIVLNHCDSPISLDFYIQVPAKNVNRTTRIYHNTLLSIPGLSYSLGQAKAQGYLYFEMTRLNNSVTFSVTVKVRVDISFVSSWPSALQRRLITNETVAVPPCPPGDRDVSDFPVLGHCHPPSWKNKTDDSKKPTHKEGLGSPCDETTKCLDDPWLMCDLTAKKCICSTNFETFQDSCRPISSVGQDCKTDADCKVVLNERCLRRTGKCACPDGEEFDKETNICMPSSHPATPPSYTDAPQTVSPAASKNTEHPPTKMSGQNTVAVIAGSSVGAIFVLGGLLMVAYFAIRRLRRPYHNRELLLEDDGDGVM